MHHVFYYCTDSQSVDSITAMYMLSHKMCLKESFDITYKSKF